MSPVQPVIQVDPCGNLTGIPIPFNSIDVQYNSVGVINPRANQNLFNAVWSVTNTRYIIEVGLLVQFPDDAFFLSPSHVHGAVINAGGDYRETRLTKDNIYAIGDQTTNWVYYTTNYLTNPLTVALNTALTVTVFNWCEKQIPLIGASIIITYIEV